MTLPLLDLSSSAGQTSYAQLLEKLQHTVSFASPQAATVAQIIADVRRDGDAAVVQYMRQWTDPQFDVGRIRVSEAELSQALRGLDKKLRRTLGAAIANVKRYQQHVMPKAAKPITVAGAELGLRFTPVKSTGLAVPGGKAAYPSSVIMLAVPALVAGVAAKNISVVTPPPDRRGEESAGDVSPLVLATCALLGIKNVYRIGGVQAIAALALGTATVKPVDLIAGPGNVFVQLAKAQLNGIVGTDNGFYGPSEIVTIADSSADPRKIAADLLAQAEHDPGKCFVIAWSRPVLERILAEVLLQAKSTKRQAAIMAALASESAAILCANVTAAAQIADQLAGEHVNLAVKNPRAWLKKIRNGGEFFLGDQTPVAAGDYFAGPSHCLPTGTTARFASGVSVYTFLKRTGTVHYRHGMPPEVIASIAQLAEAEGLDAHAASVRARMKTSSRKR